MASSPKWNGFCSVQMPNDMSEKSPEQATDLPNDDEARMILNEAYEIAERYYPINEGQGAFENLLVRATIAVCRNQYQMADEQTTAASGCALRPSLSNVLHFQGTTMRTPELTTVSRGERNDPLDGFIEQRRSSDRTPVEQAMAPAESTRAETTDRWPFWYRRLQRREGRRTADDMDYREGNRQPHYPAPTTTRPPR